MQVCENVCVVMCVRVCERVSVNYNARGYLCVSGRVCGCHCDSVLVLLRGWKCEQVGVGGVRAVICGPRPASPGGSEAAPLLQGPHLLPHWGGWSSGLRRGPAPGLAHLHMRCRVRPLRLGRRGNSFPATSRGSGARWNGKGPRESSFPDTRDPLAWDLRQETHSLTHSPPDRCGGPGRPQKLPEDPPPCKVRVPQCFPPPPGKVNAGGSAYRRSQFQVNSKGAPRPFQGSAEPFTFLCALMLFPDHEALARNATTPVPISHALHNGTSLNRTPSGGWEWRAGRPVSPSLEHG